MVYPSTQPDTQTQMIYHASAVRRGVKRELVIIDMPFLSYQAFFFNDTATTEIYTLSLHDALPICCPIRETRVDSGPSTSRPFSMQSDRKSTRLNSSHVEISYAVFCLKKKKTL